MFYQYKQGTAGEVQRGTQWHLLVKEEAEDAAFMLETTAGTAPKRTGCSQGDSLQGALLKQGSS